MVLVVVIQTWAKLLKSAKILWPGLSENFLLLSTLPMMIQISGKSTNFGSKMLAPSKKQLIGEVQSSLKSNFGLNQGYKIVLTQNH